MARQHFLTGESRNDPLELLVSEWGPLFPTEELETDGPPPCKQEYVSHRALGLNDRTRKKARTMPSHVLIIYLHSSREGFSENSRIRRRGASPRLLLCALCSFWCSSRWEVKENGLVSVVRPEGRNIGPGGRKGSLAGCGGHQPAAGERSQAWGEGASWGHTRSTCNTDISRAAPHSRPAPSSCKNWPGGHF